MNKAQHFKQELTYYAHKEAWIFPPLEGIHPNERYALTIHPKDDSKSYFEFYNDLLQNILLYFPHYYLLPELSTKNQRWHVHGTVWFNSGNEIVRFYRNIHLLKQECTFCLKTIEDPMEWYGYCIKQRHLIAPYISQLFDAKQIPKNYHPSAIPSYKIKKS